MILLRYCRARRHRVLTPTSRDAGRSARQSRSEAWKQMCDEHALYAAALREGMVGRTLTLERARQLNSRSYFYEMLKDNPALREIKPGMEDEYLVGATQCLHEWESRKDVTPSRPHDRAWEAASRHHPVRRIHMNPDRSRGGGEVDNGWEPE